MTELGAALLAVGALSVALATALWSSTNNQIANRYLAGSLLVLTGMTSVYSLGWTGRVEVPSALAFLPLNLPLALGPLLFGYVSALATGRGFQRLWPHLGPAATQALYLCVLSALPEDARRAWKDGAHDPLIKPLLEAAILVSLTAYTLAGLRLRRRYQAWLEDARSDADRYAAHWVGGVLIALLATLIVLALVRFYTWFVAELDVGPLYLWLGVWAMWLGVEGWRYTERRFPIMALAPVAAAPSGPDWAELGARWRVKTLEEGWWREPDLSLADLAARLGANTAYLSRAINEGLGVNFNEMINQMRAEEAARLIDRDDRSPLLHIALEAGFNSKATFNRVFRAVHGISPSERRRLISKESSGTSGSEASDGRDGDELGA